MKKPLFDKPTSVFQCTQQDIETIVELAIKLGLPINPFTKRDYKTADHAYISWERYSGGICRINKNCRNTVTANQFIARMHEWAAENNPKAEEWQPKRGDLVEVSDDKKNWHTRIFLADIKGSSWPIVVVEQAEENNYKNGDEFDSYCWLYMREIQQPKAEPQPIQTKEARIAELVAELNRLVNDVNQ